MRKIINLMFALAAVAFLSATLNAQPVVKPKSFYEGRTYTWTNANGGIVTSNLADPATDPRQIMALLKEVYTNKEIPGIWQCGYTDGGKREGTIDYTVKNKDAINKAYGISAGNYKPNEEGYTTLLVKVKDSWKPRDGQDLSNEETLNYIAEAIESVQILTDGIYIYQLLKRIKIRVLFIVCQVMPTAYSSCLKGVDVCGLTSIMVKQFVNLPHSMACLKSIVLWL